MRSGVPSVLLVAFGAACTPPTASTPTAVVRDSTGVRLVEYSGEPQSSTLRLSREPVFLHGSGPDDYLFQTVWSGALQPDGGAVIDDSGNREVVLLAPDGSFRSLLATQGQGPGEVRRVMSLTVLGQDTILVEDDGNSKFATFANGRLLSSVSTSGDFSLTAALRVYGLSPDGRLMMGTSAFMPGFEEPWFRGRMVLFDLESQDADTVAAFDMAPKMNMDGPSHPFMPFGTLAAADGSFVYGRSDVPEIQWYNYDGALRQAVRWSPEREYPTEQHVAERAARLRVDLRRVNPGLSGQTLEDMIERSLSRYELDESVPLPLWMDLQTDAVGRVWLAEFSAPGPMAGVDQYVVLGPEGEWLGSVQMPPRFRLLDATAEYLLGVQRDELDVEHVAVYELVENHE